MVHTTTGFGADIMRNFSYSKAKGYKPLSKGGDLYGRGRNTPYSQCMKPIKSRMAPAVAYVGPSMKSTDVETVPSMVASGAVKLIKHGRKRAR